MKNGRVVYYDPKEGKYYDPRSDMYLSDEEATALKETTQYVPQVVLHAKKGDEKLSLRLESMMGIKPAMTLLRNNGYQEFAYSDGEADEPMDVPAEFGPEEEPVESKIEKGASDIQHLLDMIQNGQDVSEISDELGMALDVISRLHASVMGDTDDDMGQEVGDMGDEGLPPRFEGEELDEGKGRTRDTKLTPSLSKNVDHRVKKALQSKERQQGRKATLDEGSQKTYSGWKAAIKKKHDGVEFEGDKDICQAFVKGEDGKRKGVGEWDGSEGTLYEATAAVNVTVFDNNAMPADAVDDSEQKAERTGQADRTATKNVVPKDVIKAIDKRIAELKAAKARYDKKGFNDDSVKSKAIECLTQIKTNLQRGDHEGFMEAQIFFTTLMSPIWDMIPAQVVNYLAKGDDRDDPDGK
jgi:hypothetical protein